MLSTSSEVSRASSVVETDGSLLQRISATHYIWVALAALLAGMIYLQEPGFGDDFTYWRLAYRLHEIGRHAWSAHSFHDLRWPVWGPSWIWQGVFGPGLSSFYFVPVAQLAAAAVLAFMIGGRILGGASGGWICAAALLFAPIIDPVISRPMPDLNESILDAVAILGWWQMMNSERRRSILLGALLCGVSIGLAFSNRITGLFIAPVLAIATAIFFPRSWRRLLLPAAMAGGYFLAESTVYYLICGDWLHSIHANLQGEGAKDAGVMALWQLPIRFLNAFFRGNRLAPLYTACAVYGMYVSWRSGGRLARLLVIWCCTLYLEYSCTIQSLHPLRPLIGNTMRYMAVLALPLAVLAGVGCRALTSNFMAMPWVRVRAGKSPQRWIGFAFAAVIAIAVLASRPFFNLGFIPAMKAHMAALPDGTRIFTHDEMRDLAYLIDGRKAARFDWKAPHFILEQSDELENAAADCQQFWYLRKLLWLTSRKEMEHGRSSGPFALGSYLETPERDWILSEVLAKGDEPELVFYRRRPDNSPEPHILSGLDLRPLLPPLPATWNAQRDRKDLQTTWNLPADLKGKLLNVHIHGSSTSVEPVNLRLDFTEHSRVKRHYLFKPIFSPGGGHEFVALSIPQAAEKCRVSLSFLRTAKEVRIDSARVAWDDSK